MSDESKVLFGLCDQCGEGDCECDENESGVEIDFFGNRVSWVYSCDDYLISFYLNGEEITCWSIETEAQVVVIDFMKTWNLAQKSNPQK
ncbi:MAG: hypothetical protein ACJAUY_000625 [Cognaticolwellia sp.]|jgi:hypothetical protein